MAIRLTASQRGKQNFTLKYAPNPVSEGAFSADGKNGLCYVAHLDNNGMEYVVRIKALAKGGSVTYADGQLTVTNADEVTLLLTADLPTTRLT